MSINSITQNLGIFDNINPVTPSTSSKDVSGAGSTSFSDTLKNVLDNVNDKQVQADALTSSFIKGDSVDVTQVMIASEEAKQSLELAVQVRNKLVEAFQEINKIQL